MNNLKNYCIQYWFCRETSFTGKLVSQGNWFFWETGFLLRLLKFSLLYLLWNKLLIIQKLVTLQFCDLLRNEADGSNWRKTPTRKMSQGNFRMKFNLSRNHNTKKHSCLILLVHSFHFNLVLLIFIKQIFI